MFHFSSFLFEETLGGALLPVIRTLTEFVY
jgi:hypothetical protein